MGEWKQTAPHPNRAPVAGMSNHPHRRRRRTTTTLPRIRWAGLIDHTDAAQRIDACDCPAVITTGAGLVTVEHHHRTGCPQLDRPDQ